MARYLPFVDRHSVSLSYEILSPDKIELSTPFMPYRVARFLILLNTSLLPVYQTNKYAWPVFTRTE